MSNAQTNQQAAMGNYSFIAVGTWDKINAPGTYVEVQGRVAHKIIRISKQALRAGSPPLIRPPTREGVNYIRLSQGMLLTDFEAELLCAENNYLVNF